jgi:hypothetical protein
MLSTADIEKQKSSVIKIVQELLIDEATGADVTPSMIAEMIDRVLVMKPAWGTGLDRASVTDELIRRFSVWVGEDATLIDNAGHVPWLTSERKTNWRYWQRYREWQEGKLPWSAVESVDKSTDSILSMLEDPTRDGPWDRRGLVVGHVQSGKTGNFTGLVCKAADAGYKIIIVLAGLHNNLRSQTQMRLDEGFLGFETGPTPGATRLIGVGKIDGSPSIRPHYATNRSNGGDFNAAFVRNLGVAPEERPWLFVVKKNKSILTRLLTWLRDHVANSQDKETGRKLITHLPVLIIDDESDQASVDTGETVIGSDGSPDLEHEPTAINSKIRQILHTFTRSAYVGYTATPFANIFIHDKGETAEEGPDLFPSAFISNLAAPSSYIGPAKVFGLSAENGREGGLPLVRVVSDFCDEDGNGGWMPHAHKSTFHPTHPSLEGMPASLVEAIHSFILTCAIRALRGQGAEHSSMLIHVTRFNKVQQVVHAQVKKYVDSIKQRLSLKIDEKLLLSELRTLWEQDFIPTSTKIAAYSGPEENCNLPDWIAVTEQIVEVLESIDVKMINGTAKDALDYADTPSGLKVIAIGGDKLARGLTLEGLSVSYFLRASKMYDTLMQMGRWFGYRHGYLDLCRLYTTGDLVEWFEHIADASEELRDEFDMMCESGGKPIDYGLKVKSHSVLMVTSRLKMRAAKPLYLSFSGQISETVAFFKDQSVLHKNLAAFDRLVDKMGPAGEIPEQVRKDKIDRWRGAYWKNVSAEKITAFLYEYETHPESLKVNSKLLARFIDAMVPKGELTDWTIAIISGSSANLRFVAGKEINLMKRAGKKLVDRYAIGRLLSPKDEALDLDGPAWDAALMRTRAAWKGDEGRARKEEPEIPNGPAIRRVRGFGDTGVEDHPERALLIISLLDPEQAEDGLPSGTPPIVAFAISFPGSASNTKVEYMVNNVHWKSWEQQYGACD